MKKHRRGFTLIELMAVIAVVGVVGVLAVIGIRRLIGTGAGHNQAEAQRQAQDWAQRMGLSGAQVTCATAVTNKEAMVPCSVAVPGMGGPLIYGLECGPAISLSGQEGCRVTSAPAVMPLSTGRAQ